MTDERADNETVSKGYRALAKERTPVQLDRKVLSMAANHVEHSQYTRSTAWTRPLAWAATVALCLAITLQFTRVPAPEEIASSPAAAADPATFEKLESAAGRASALHEEADIAAPARLRQNDEVATLPAASFARKSADSDALQQAEEIARLQNGTNLQERRMLPVCPEEARSSPESWLKCIEDLEKTGDQEAAIEERRSLVAVFPEFKLP